MPAWRFVGFDWSRYHALAPMLMEAARSRDFSSLPNRDAADLVSSLDPGLSPEEICNLVIAELCTEGDEVDFRGTFPDFVRYVRRRDPEGEAADLLAEAAFAAPNIESWFEHEPGLVGILTWAKLDHLRSHLEGCIREGQRRQRRSRLQELVDLVRPAPSHDDLLQDLFDLVTNCLEKRLGLAVLMTEG